MLRKPNPIHFRRGIEPAEGIGPVALVKRVTPPQHCVELCSTVYSGMRIVLVIEEQRALWTIYKGFHLRRYCANPQTT